MKTLSLLLLLLLSQVSSAEYFGGGGGGGGGGSSAWGGITGTLSDQSDLQTALNAKLSTALANGKFIVGNGSGVATAVTPTGDVTFTNSGVFAIGSAKVTNSMLAGSITANNVLNVTNASNHVLTGYTSGSGTVAATDTILAAIQKLNGNAALKAPSDSPTFTTQTTYSYATASTVPYLDASKHLVSSSVTPTQLGYLDATSSIQTQLNAKQSSLTFSQSLLNSSGTVTLSGDSATPGNSKYYGTDSGGTKGYFSLPGGGSSSIGAFYHGIVAQTANGAFQIAKFQTMDKDDSGIYSSSTGLLTVPSGQGGVWHAEGGFYIGNYTFIAGDYIFVALFNTTTGINTVARFMDWNISDTQANNPNFTFSASIPASAGDTIAVKILSTNPNILGSTTSYNAYLAAWKAF